MKKVIILLSAIMFVFSFTTSIKGLAARGLTADEVINNMFAAYEKQMSNIEDATIVTDFDTKYLKRAEIDGETVYMIRTEMEIGPDDKIITVWDGEFQYFTGPDGKLEKQRERFDRGEIVHQLLGAEVEYIGKDNIDGYDTHVLGVKGLDMRESDTEYQRMDGEVWIDAKDWIPRKLDLKIPADEDEEEDSTLVVFMKDYRNYQGMLIPFITKMVTEAYSDLTPEEQQEMREKLAEMEREMEQMPQEQREMLGSMFDTHIQTMKDALETGEYVMTIKVMDVQVNTGLSDEIFDGELLGE